MTNTTVDLVTLRINFFRQMNDFINKNGDNHDLITWTDWIIRNTATTIVQDDDLWSSLCALFDFLAI